MRRLWRAVVALAAWTAAAGAAASPSAWQANDDDILLLDAHLGQYRLGNGIRGYQTPEGVCVDLKDVVLALDIPVEFDKSKGVAEGWAFEERNQLRIDRNAGKILAAGKQQPLAASDVRDTPEGWCVASSALSNWLGVKLVPDLANALLLIQPKSKLPVELAAERRARAARVRPEEKLDLARLPQARLPYQMWRTPALDAVVTLGGLSDRKRGRRVDRQYELYASGEAAMMSVDARLSSDNDGEPSNFRARAYRSDSQGKLLGPLGATHFALGDVSSFASPLVSRSIPGRGAIVTNRPIDRPDTFDRKTFRGELPTGWDAEIYRNGQLLGVAQNRLDGRYEFVDVPLLFGNNRFEIVLYGPQGQVRREHETVVVGLDSISPKETWYWAGISQDEHDMFVLKRRTDAEGRGWRVGVGVERGLDAQTSVSLQIQSLLLHDERLTYVEGAIRRSIGPALVELAGVYEASGGLAARAQLLGQIGETYISAESILAHDFISDRVDPGVTGSHSLAIQHAFDLGKAVVPVQVEGRYIQRREGNDSLELGTRVSASVGRVSLTGTLDWSSQRRGYGPDPPDTVEAALLGNGSIRSVRLRGEMRWRLAPENRFQSAELVAQKQLGESTDLRAEIGYDRGLDRVRGAVGYVRRFDRLALSVTGEAASDGSVAAGLNLAFSLGSNPRGGGLRVASDKLASMGTTLARVFHDENADGVRQPEEKLAPEVQLKVNRTPIERLTDKNGLAVIDNLEPHRPVLVGVDSTSLPDPLVQAAGPGVVVTPRPGLAVPIDLPLVSAGEVLGTLVGLGGASIEGVDLQLVDGSGLVAGATRSDFDGFFLFESVAYGSYTLRIAKLSADAAGLLSELPVTVEVNGKRPSVKLGRVTAMDTETRRLLFDAMVFASLEEGVTGR